MQELFDQIDKARLPRHIAVIMDGNGRWAKQHGQPRVFGHTHGVRAVRIITEAAAELNIEYLTLYTFSTENWQRPKLEVAALMSLLVDTMEREIDDLHKNNIRLQTIGDLTAMPNRTRNALLRGIERTAGNTGTKLILALNYSGRWEITRAVQQIAQASADGLLKPRDITDDVVAHHLSTAGIPDPELLIRTSGEHRLSNFLLWQLAYAEFCFLPIFWPDFRREHLYQAILDFQNRERRYGKTGEQLNS
jgi:undecaprenyl diphosphate synthase